MRYDVIVAGAGPSGCMAALAAARMGATVLLVEKNPFPGGSNTAAMVCPLMTFHSGDKQIVRGIAQEVIDRLAARGATLGHIPDPLGVTSTITPIEPSALRLVYFEMLAAEPNITLLLHSFLCDARMERGGRHAGDGDAQERHRLLPGQGLRRRHRRRGPCRPVPREL